MRVTGNGSSLGGPFFAGLDGLLAVAGPQRAVDATDSAFRAEHRSSSGSLSFPSLATGRSSCQAFRAEPSQR